MGLLNWLRVPVAMHLFACGQVGKVFRVSRPLRLIRLPLGDLRSSNHQTCLTTSFGQSHPFVLSYRRNALKYR